MTYFGQELYLPFIKRGNMYIWYYKIINKKAVLIKEINLNNCTLHKRACLGQCTINSYVFVSNKKFPNKKPICDDKVLSFMIDDEWCVIYNKIPTYVNGLRFE